MRRSRTSRHAQRAPASKKAGASVFLRLEDLLSHYAQIAPNRHAILAPNSGPISYAELWRRVDAGRQQLRSLGVGPTDRVAVVLPNGPDAAVAMLVVATAAVCVPLNPSYTADEWHCYFADLNVTALLTRPDLGSVPRSVAHTLGIRVIDLSAGANEDGTVFSLLGDRRDGVAGELWPASHNDAFALLTSGTTMRPKVVPLTHASVCLSAFNAGATLALQPRDRLLNVLPLFHAHGLISGLLTGLAAGSTVICTPGFDAKAFFDWLGAFRPTWYTAVPTIHRALLAVADSHQEALRRCSLRLIRSASAPLAADVFRQLEATFGVPVIETYGMTEAASQIAANPINRRKPGSVGQPAGAEIAIMDEEGRRLAAGNRGEIVLRGPSITRGYDNDPAATEASFRDGWFRTGDLGYLDDDGYLFIVGRSKDVIKRGGQQVAPGEVEAALLNHPEVVEAVAFSIPHPRLGEDIAAAVILKPGAKVSAHSLRGFVRERLAHYKVPGVIKFVAAIPKTAGGKIKRDGLAAQLSITAASARQQGRREIVAPISELQRRLAAIWANLLQLDHVGIEEDIFALGADSLTVTQVLSRLREELGADLSFQDLFDAPTIASLAARLQASARLAGPAAASLRNTPAESGPVPLSFQQQRLYLLSRLDPASHNFQVVEVARLLGPLDVEALQASLSSLCQRHAVLRSTFGERQGEPVQTVGAHTPGLQRLDLEPCGQRKRASVLRQRARQAQQTRLQIEKEPPLRAELLRFANDDHALIITLHHLITDGWSQRLFWDELGALYASRIAAKPGPLPELPVQYKDFVHWQRAWLETPAAAKQLDYWLAQLRGMPELPLHSDRPRPAIWTGRGARQPLRLPRELTARIKALGQVKGATLFMTLLAAFNCLLFRYTEQADVAVGSLIANRNQTLREPVIGMFANTIVLRSDLSGDPTFSELLQRVRRVALEAYRNQDLPIEKILQLLQVPRSLARTALFQVMFVLQNAPARAPRLPGLSLEFVDIDPGIARFDLTLELAQVDGRLRGWFEYNSDLFAAATIARMAGNFHTLLETIVANPEEQLSRLDFVSPQERTRMLIDWNASAAPLGRGDAFPDRFARQVAAVPEAPAVSAEGADLNYRELADRSTAIAHRLASLGIGPNSVVTLLCERDVTLLAAMIAVLQAGGAFLCLDPAFPPSRLAQVLQSSRTPLVLAARGGMLALNTALMAIPAQLRPQILQLEDIAQGEPAPSLRSPRSRASDLAYVVYTSGSTGAAKGAMIERRGLFNHLRSQIADLNLSAADVVAHTAPQSYVISVWQFLAPLLVGARVHICPDAAIRDPVLLAQEIERRGVTILQIVPALLRRILERVRKEPPLRALARLRCLISTGEPLPPDLCRSWFESFPQVPLLNAYGSAECSDDVATYRLTGPVASSVPIGRPIANTRLYVLDAHLQPVPIGVKGELYVGGIGVGRGYLNDAVQSRRSFSRDPFVRRRDGRMYRTGDLARWRADGVLECLGRVDQQVKIRGHRIELGEIEHTLLQHSQVAAATVLAQATAGEVRLIAYIVPASGRGPEPNELRNFLKQRVPAYMLPAGFIFLEQLPLTLHGKLDRPALAAMRLELRITGNEFVAARTQSEKILAKIWRDLLQVDEIGIFSNFFDVGGHSLLAGQIVARVAADCGVSLPIQALFEAPTIEALARRVDRARELTVQKAAEIVPFDSDGPQPVSILQEQVLRIERALPGLPQFNLPFAYRLQGPLNVAALNRSLAEVFARHPALRTAFAWQQDGPVALLAKAHFALSIEDLAPEILSRTRRAKALLHKKVALKAEQQAWTPFDLARAPLCRGHLYRLAPEDHVLLLVLHHVVADGWSIGLILDEVSKLYAVFATGNAADLPRGRLAFADVARWQRSWCAGAGAARQLAYWKEELRGASPVFAGNHDLKGAVLGSRVVHQPVRLPSDLIARLDALARSQAATLFTTLLTAFKVMLLARTGRGDICVATAMANRSQPGTEQVIGPLENTTLIRTQLHWDLSFRDALERVRGKVLAAHANQDLPFKVVAKVLAEDGGVDPAALTQAFFVMQNPTHGGLKLPDLRLRPFGNVYREGQPVLAVDRTWLTIMLKKRPAGITGSCCFKEDFFESGTIRRWLVDWRRILTRAVAHPEASLASFMEEVGGCAFTARDA